MKIIKYLLGLSLLFAINFSESIPSYHGVLDRFEDDGQAVLLIESLQTTLIIPSDSLPPNSEVNMWFTVKFVEDTYEITKIDYKMTNQQNQKVLELFEQLKIKKLKKY